MFTKTGKHDAAVVADGIISFAEFVFQVAHGQTTCFSVLLGFIFPSEPRTRIHYLSVFGHDVSVTKTTRLVTRPCTQSC